MKKLSRRKQIEARMEAREKLRADLIAWLAWANSVLVTLQVDVQEMRETLAPLSRPASALAKFLSHDKAAQIEGVLEAAVSAVSSVVVPALDYPKPDALVWNTSASATIE